MYAYETTHPWLTFSINLSRAPAKLWALLGECSALCGVLSDIPLMPEDRKHLLDESIARGTIDSFRVGTASLTYEETLSLVRGTLVLPPSRRYQAREAENIIKAMNTIREGIGSSTEKTLSPQTIRRFNEYVLDGVVMPGGAFPGDYRTGDPDSGEHVGNPVGSSETPVLMENLCDWLNSGTFSSSQEMAVAFGLLKTVIGRLYLNWICPFGAGNDRTAALFDYYQLLIAGAPPLACALMSAHYARTGAEYRRRLDAAGREDGKMLPFIHYAVAGFRDGLMELVDRARRMQKTSLWEHYTHLLFLDKTSPADLRRRDLAFELHRLGKTISLTRIMVELPRLATYYVARSQKTLMRDIADLVRLGIVEKNDDGYCTRDDILV